jgi:hypothetical protein
MSFLIGTSLQIFKLAVKTHPLTQVVLTVEFATRRVGLSAAYLAELRTDVLLNGCPS